MCIDEFCSINDFFLGEMVIFECDIFYNGIGKKEYILQDNGDMFVICFQVKIFNGCVINFDLFFLYFIKLVEDINNCRFIGVSVVNNSECFFWFYFEVDIFKYVFW